MTTTATQIERPDGRVELVDTSTVERSPLYNEDLAPVPIARRNWTTYNYAALWISMAHCIPTYMLSAGLMAAGHELVAGALHGRAWQHHRPRSHSPEFPSRHSLRHSVSGLCPCRLRDDRLERSGAHARDRRVWLVRHSGLDRRRSREHVLHERHSRMATICSVRGFGGHSTTEWLSFLIFWSLNVAIVYRGMDLLRKVENWAAPFVLVMTALLLAWAVTEANGFGPLLSQPGKYPTLREFLPVFVPSLTAMIGFWATLSLNMPDFTRFGRSQREQVIGQVVALPTTMFVFAAMGVLITSATAIIYGEVIWDPIKLIGRFSNPLVIAISMFTAVVATLAVNIAANVVSPANDFANAFPRLIRFKTGGLITGILGILIQPWRLLADPSGYIYNWLLGYSGGLGSIAGVLIADYWIVRKRQLSLEDLYLARWTLRPLELGRHSRRRSCGCALAWGGLVVRARCGRCTTTRGSSALQRQRSPTSRSDCLFRRQPPAADVASSRERQEFSNSVQPGALDHAALDIGQRM